MATQVNMRDKVTKVYPGDKWKNQVKHMTDDQILAIYIKFLRNGRIKD